VGASLEDFAEFFGIFFGTTTLQIFYFATLNAYRQRIKFKDSFFVDTGFSLLGCVFYLWVGEQFSVGLSVRIDNRK